MNFILRKEIMFGTLFICILGFIEGQNDITDSIRTVKLEEVIITANRLPVYLKSNPGSISLVSNDVLLLMPKSIGAEEALRLVPGVRVDNQHDAERVHISIRGQGILTERGLRGIGVIIDGIPVNDPSGFAPDLYDVDWNTVKKIEVLRGPAGLYGGGSAAGVLNITTNGGGQKAVCGELSQTIGTNGFAKSFIQMDGTKDMADYRISFSRSKGDGYRDHQAFWSNKLYEKVSFHFSDKISLTQIISHTDYFQQNPEGLNTGQFGNLKQANPDARPFNEYQKTNRTTLGLLGNYKISEKQDIQMTMFLRSWKYKETSNKCAEYRDCSVPGGSVQYNLQHDSRDVKNQISFGMDIKLQNIDMYKLQSASNPQRVENIDETNIETDSLLANQIISQNSFGGFVLYKLEYNTFNLMGSFRYDVMNNELTDKMVPLALSKTSKKFNKLSARLGLCYSFSDLFNFFINYSQGFLPPSTEELASNPLGYNGFNTHLVPAASNCIESGLRGSYKDFLKYELTGFVMHTENDFFRFKQSGRGNQEVFYGNAGNSNRNGIETFVSIGVLKNLDIQIAYTFADYKYTSATVDPVYTDTAYVLTTPPDAGQWVPNSPKHQLYSELVYSINKNFKICFGTEYQSKWAIYTDAKAYRGDLDPAIYRNWQDGFNLYNARISYQWKFRGLKGEYSMSARNITGVKYIAFTEPDPDGNAYHPGPRREFFGNIKIKF